MKQIAPKYRRKNPILGYLKSNRNVSAIITPMPMRTARTRRADDTTGFCSDSKAVRTLHSDGVWWLLSMDIYLLYSSYQGRLSNPPPAATFRSFRVFRALRASKAQQLVRTPSSHLFHESSPVADIMEKSIQSDMISARSTLVRVCFNVGGNPVLNFGKTQDKRGLA